MKTVIILMVALSLSSCAWWQERLDRVNRVDPEAQAEEKRIDDQYQAAVSAYFEAVTQAAWRFSASTDSAEDIADAALSACSSDAVKCRDAVESYWKLHAAPAHRINNTNRLMIVIMDAAKMHAKHVVVERRTQSTEKPSPPPAPPKPQTDYSRA